MQTFTCSGRVAHGRLAIAPRTLDQMRSALKGWKACDVTVTVEQRHATRSHEQNRYYWGVVVALIAEHTGYTPEETHDALKTLFLPKRLAMLGRNGEMQQELVIGGSTTRLNKVEFSEYVDQIREWAHRELTITIPLPSESEAA